jgi:hypothetical protein
VQNQGTSNGAHRREKHTLLLLWPPPSRQGHGQIETKHRSIPAKNQHAQAGFVMVQTRQLTPILTSIVMFKTLRYPAKPL